MAVLELLGRRWAMRILWEPSQARAGFRELQRRCERMSSSALSTRLDELSRARLLTLHEGGYRLTRLGRDLVEAPSPPDAWSRRRARESESDTDTTGDRGLLEQVPDEFDAWVRSVADRLDTRAAECEIQRAGRMR